MNWLDLTSVGQLDSIAEQSATKPVVLFKHSTRCSISHMAKGRLDRSKDIASADFYYLDLIAHRDVSDAIAEKFKVHHESPQILIIKNGECTYSETHGGITVDELQEQLQESA